MNAPMDKNTNPRLSQAGIAASTSVQTRAAVQAAAAAAAAAQPAAGQGGAPDVEAMIRRVIAHWPVIIVTMVLGALVTSQVVRLRKATFKSETVIQYREGIGKSVSGPNSDTTDMRSLGSKLKEVLLAQQNLRKIIDEFHLYPDVVAKAGYSDAVDQMRKKTEFKARSLDTFAIAFEGLDRDQAQKVCARMADLLITENVHRLQEENKGTTEFLEAEKKRAEEELNRVEREMSEFLQAHPEFASARDGTLGTEVLAIQTKANEEEKRRNRPKTPRGTRRGTPGPAGPAAAAEERAPAVDPVLIAARTQAMTDLLSAKRDLADKSSRFTDQHPDVRAAADRVAGAEAALHRAEEAITLAAPKEEIRPKKVVIEDPYGEPAAKPRPVAVAPNPDGEEHEKPKPKPKAGDADQSDRVVSIETEWAKLTRAHALGKGRQANLENKLYRAEMMASTVEAGFGNNIVVLDPAYKPGGPSNAPNKTVVLMGLAASIAVGLVISAAWGLFLDNRLFSSERGRGQRHGPRVRRRAPRQAQGEAQGEGAGGCRGGPLPWLVPRRRRKRADLFVRVAGATLDRTIECLVRGSRAAGARLAHGGPPAAQRRRQLALHPPPRDVRDEMLHRVVQLSSAVGAAFPEALPEIAAAATQGPKSSGSGDEATEGYALDFEPRLYSLDIAASPQAAPGPRRPLRPTPGRAPRSPPWTARERPRSAPRNARHIRGSRSDERRGADPGVEQRVAPGTSGFGAHAASAPAPWPVEEPPSRRSCRPTPACLPIAGRLHTGPAGHAPPRWGARPSPSQPELRRSRASSKASCREPWPPAPSPPRKRPTRSQGVRAEIITYQLDGEGDNLSVPRTQIVAHTPSSSPIPSTLCSSSSPIRTPPGPTPIGPCDASSWPLPRPACSP